MTGSAALAGARDRVAGTREVRGVAHRRAVIARMDGRGQGTVFRNRSYAGRRHWLLSLMLAVVLAWCGMGIWSVQSAQSDTGATDVVGYTVRPGDTLWSYASSITPEGQDVQQTVDDLIALNDLDSGSLRAGQHILVPQMA